MRIVASPTRRGELAQRAAGLVIPPRPQRRPDPVPAPAIPADPAAALGGPVAGPYAGGYPVPAASAATNEGSGAAAPERWPDYGQTTYDRAERPVQGYQSPPPAAGYSPPAPGYGPAPAGSDTRPGQGEVPEPQPGEPGWPPPPGTWQPPAGAGQGPPDRRGSGWAPRPNGTD